MRTATRKLRERIGDEIARGATLEEVETQVLDSAEVSEDSRDALWLYAWSLADRPAAGTGDRVPAVTGR